MDEDLSTYRCTIESFISWRGACGARGTDAGLMKFSVSFCQLIKVIGSLTFIGMLLLMTGIESNPGPTDTFIFRYLYLLIDIGTKVLRGMFDEKVGHDFVAYLEKNKKQKDVLKALIDKHIIKDNQKKLLPPYAEHPDTSKYDITLLALLLRSICGLSPANDDVWKEPKPSDKSVEANITRLRLCRNEAMHMASTRISKEDFDKKWDYMDQILNSLNKTGAVANLPQLIAEAKVMDINEDLHKQHLETMEAWTSMDNFLQSFVQGI